MGKVVATFIQDKPTGNNTPMIYAVKGSAKALSNHNCSGTTVFRVSLNVSGLVDNGTGNTSISVTSSFATSNYVSTAITCTAASSLGACPYQGAAKTTSTFMFVSFNYAGTQLDHQDNDLVHHGILA